MKRLKIVLILVLATFFIVSCGKEESLVYTNNTQKDTTSSEISNNITQVSKDNTSNIPLLNLKEIPWTNEEKAYIYELNKKGSIKIATKIADIVYMPQKDGSITGVHYNILKGFADLAKIKVDVKLIEWSDFFYKEGEDIEKVKIDLNYTYVPTLFEDVDLFLAGVTALPWREKMMDFIKFIPNRQMLISKRDNKPKTFEDLNNKTFYLMKNTSMEETLNIIKKEKKLNLKYMYTADLDTVARAVSEGKADFTILDSDLAFASCYKYKNLTISMPISEIEMMGWCINKKNNRLKIILEKYLKYAQDKNILDKYWLEQYDVSFIDYLKIIELK